MPEPPTQTAAPEPAPRKRRRRRWLWRAALLLLVLAVVTPLGVVYWYTRPAQLIPVVEEALYQSTGCRATIEHAEVNTKGELTMRGVTLSVPGAAEPYARFMTVERIDMAGRFRELLDGSYRPTRIDLVNPVLHLTEQADTGVFNYELLSAPEGGDPDKPIPRVSIKNGTVRFNQMLPDRLASLGAMGVEGELRPDPGVPKGYTFTIAETDAPDGVQNIAFTGRFDLKAPSLDMTAEHFRFNDEQRYFVPAEFRDWWSRLEPTGEVPELKLALRPNENNLLDLHEVRLKLVDVGLNLDVLDFDNPEQRDIAILLRTIRSRLTRLSGAITVDRDSFELTGTGRIEQSGLGLSPIAYAVNASGGINEDAPFTVTLHTDPFTLSRAYQFGLAFSPLTGEGYRRFRPSGRFQLSANVNAPGGDEDIDWALDIDVLKGRMTHAMFPVPLHDVAGKIHINAERVKIGPFTARARNEALIQLEGFAKPVSDIAEVKLDINIKGMPIDGVLREALDPSARENLERFFNRDAYQALIDRDIIAPTEQADSSDDADDNTPPAFTLGGKCDVYVPVHRPYGEDQDYSVTPVLDANGLSLLMADFPYPVNAQGGAVTIGGDFVEIKNLQLTSPTGGRMTLNGDAKKGDDGEYRPQVTVSDATFPIDDLLLAALGDEAEQLLTDLNVTGEMALSGKVFQPDDADEPDLAFDVNVKDGTTTPYGGRVTVRDVQGSFKLRSEGLDDLSLTGTRGEARVGIAGRVDWSQEDRTSASLTFTPTNMRWSPELVDVLPPAYELRAELAELYEEYEPAGLFDATIQWTTRGGDTEDDFNAELKPRTLALNLLGGRMDFVDMTGRVRVYRDLMQLDALRGAFNDPGQPDGKGVLQATGDIGFDKQPRIGLTFTGRAHTASPTARLLLPDGATSVIDTIDFQGIMDLTDAELVMTDTGGAQQTTAFDAVFKLSDSAMNVGGVAVSGFTGGLVVGVKDQPDGKLPAMSYELSAEAMRVFDRTVENFRISADNTADRAVLRSGRGTGSVYGGTVVLESSMDLSADGGARVRASIHDVGLEPLLKPDAPRPKQDNPRVVERTEDTGLVSAAVMLDASYSPDGPRYGTGNMSFRNAQVLSDTQLGLLLMQALSLKFPDPRGFDRGAADFDIQGNTLTFRSLWMENRGTQLAIAGQRIYAQGLRLDGTGTITFPQAKLDLRLNTSSTGTTSKLPFRDLVDRLLNEIASYRVTGTLENPDVKYQAFRGTRDALGGDGKAE